VLLAFSFAACRVQAAGETASARQPAPDITVEPGNYGAVSPADIAVVLRCAAEQIWRHCPGVQLPGIDVYCRSDHPQMDLRRSADGRIHIGLSARDARWAQYTFQFAHEFCHALANFGDAPDRFERLPAHANLWLEESLCETASLYALRGMARSWRDAPPYPAWRDYWPSFDSYAAERLALPRNHLPPGVAFSAWLEQHEPDLRHDPARRDRNTIVATRLLPLFEADPGGWEAVVFLNRDSAADKDSLPEHLAAWRQAAPPRLRPFVSGLAQCMGVTLQDDAQP
jgi:hypothetical protein